MVKRIICVAELQSRLHTPKVRRRVATSARTDLSLEWSGVPKIILRICWCRVPSVRARGGREMG
jgi:hypothetical protein